MIISETDRLVLRKLNDDDAAFILGLLNEPSFLENIGDKGVRNLEDAKAYIRTGPLDMYERLGFGLWLVELKPKGVPIGLCGLIKRDLLEDVDIGVAFLPDYCQMGFAFEAASVTMDLAWSRLQLDRVVAITSQGNTASGKLLNKLGFTYEGLIDSDLNEAALKYFVQDNPSVTASG